MGGTWTRGRTHTDTGRTRRKLHSDRPPGQDLILQPFSPFLIFMKRNHAPASCSEGSNQVSARPSHKDMLGLHLLKFTIAPLLMVSCNIIKKPWQFYSVCVLGRFKLANCFSSVSHLKFVQVWNATVCHASRLV